MKHEAERLNLALVIVECTLSGGMPGRLFPMEPLRQTDGFAIFRG